MSLRRFKNAKFRAITRVNETHIRRLEDLLRFHYIPIIIRG